MKRSRFTEEQIIQILKEHQAGLSAADNRARTILHALLPAAKNFFTPEAGAADH